jgi:hypothetical protein
MNWEDAEEKRSGSGGKMEVLTPSLLLNQDEKVRYSARSGLNTRPRCEFRKAD